MKTFKRYILEQSTTDPVKDAMASIIRTLNGWGGLSKEQQDKLREECKQGKSLNENENKLKTLLDALKGSSETNRDYFIENLKELEKYENLLIKDLYKDNNDAKTKLQNYIDQIDSIVEDKINKSAGATTPTDQAPATTPTATDQAPTTPTSSRDLSSKLTPEESESLSKKLEEMGFEL